MTERGVEREAAAAVVALELGVVDVVELVALPVVLPPFFLLSIGIADGMSIARVWPCRYSK